MQSEKIDCPICESAEQQLIFKSRDFRFKNNIESFNIVKCVKCGLIFLNPRPIQKDIACFYPSGFYQIRYSLRHKVFSPLFKISQSSIIGLLKKVIESGKVLDIGCGAGHFILEMQRRGYDVYGVEVSKNAWHFTPDSLKEKIFNKNLEDCGFQENSFDIITMFQSLEHIHNLNKLIKEARRILKPNGIMYISIPNADFFEYRLFGPYAYTLDVPRHLYFFTKHSLRNLLSKYGFTIDDFTRNLLAELFITPTSVYRGVWNYLEEKHGLKNMLLKLLSFMPLVILGLFSHVLFIYEGHILEAVCKKYLIKNE